MSVNKHLDTQSDRSRRVWLRFLPAYSPDFNPIELVFSRLRAHLRRIRARSDVPLMEAIGNGLNAVTAADALTCFRHAGYR